MGIWFMCCILNTKLISEQVFKIKNTANGLEKALEKTDAFNPEN